ncbi:transcriptional regulator [Microtetraspora sp. NBRC 13810]|uniref:DUF397 domain-containing protein n=1 Tax=Microtetraspora sp. NBRC 13810 TaxID=3030990 RepID=UPI0024A163BE|nr:DUF397 domain-containing protein [Microtetraspora sp. NBRC 13810]GLW12866.1 transcriptional regulator [Microtetraspora sp. NBRC 13810]
MRQVDLSRVEWRKSSLSSDDTDFVEVATVQAEHVAGTHKSDAADHLYLLRDSKHPDGPILVFTPGEWQAFMAGVKDGEFDDLT